VAATALTASATSTTTTTNNKRDSSSGGHKHHKPVQEFSDNFALDRKIKEACIGLKPSTQHLLLELPRKRAVLPQPCPLCERTDGTYQFVIFNHKNVTSRRAVICRIGHYDSGHYLLSQIKCEEKSKRPCGKMWHSFKVQARLYITRNGKEVELGDFFDTFKEDMWWETSRTIKPTPEISNQIKKWGWQMIPEESLEIARRKVKEHLNVSTIESLADEDIMKKIMQKREQRWKKQKLLRQYPSLAS
jgi:hypothetical protein